MLGRRLVDVRFFHGHTDSAIDLAEDILYNLRQVYGPLHPSAVQMMNLLSSIYMSKGDRAAAMAVHEGVDSGIANVGSHDNSNLAPLEDASQADKVMRSKIQDLLQYYQRNDGHEHSEQQSTQLIDELAKRLHGSVPNAKGKTIETHQPPTNWSFAADEAGTQDGKVEELA